MKWYENSYHPSCHWPNCDCSIAYGLRSMSNTAVEYFSHKNRVQTSAKKVKTPLSQPVQLAIITANQKPLFWHIQSLDNSHRQCHKTTCYWQWCYPQSSSVHIHAIGVCSCIILGSSHRCNWRWHEWITAVHVSLATEGRDMQQHSNNLKPSTYGTAWWSNRGSLFWVSNRRKRHAATPQ